MFGINTNDIYSELERYSLTPEQYELCLDDISRKINKVTDEDWQDILDRYGINMHYDTIRKASQTIFGGAFVSDYMSIKKSESKTQLAKAKELITEQYLLKKQIQTEKSELNKFKKGFVKSLSIAEEVINYFASNGLNITIPETCKTPIISNGDNTMVLIISDWHIGYRIINCKGNSYNFEIANNRIDWLIDACRKYIQLYNINKVYVFNLGDTIEHSYMRKNQNDSNEFKQSVQISKAIELVFRLLVALSESDCNVVYDSVTGNHDRSCGDKSQNYDGDNANGTITPLLRMLVETSGNKRICVVDRNCADNEIITEINGIRFKFVHGDKNLKNDQLKNEISMDNQFYDVYVGAHFHNYKCVAENRGRYIISNGCLSGFNDYSTGFGCATDAEQTIIVVGNNEIEMVKDVNLA